MDDFSRFKVILSQDEIERTVARLAEEINRDYQGRRLFLLGVLKGSFVFMADLVRHLHVPVEIDFVRLASYGPGTKSSGKVRLVHGPGASVRGKDVLVVEDIVDSGLTITFLLEYLRRRKPASLRLCSLFMKGSPQSFPFPIDYLGAQVPEVFVVGYGLDFNERYRNLPDLRELTTDQDAEEVVP